MDFFTYVICFKQCDHYSFRCPIFHFIPVRTSSSWLLRHFDMTPVVLDSFLAFSPTRYLRIILCISCHRHGTSLKRIPGGFLGGAVVGSLPANAGDTGSSPGLGGSHMPRSNWAREPQLLSLRVWSLCSATGEAAIVRGPRTAMKSGPRSPQLEKALAQKRRPNTAKNKNNKINKLKKKKKRIPGSF